MAQEPNQPRPRRTPDRQAYYLEYFKNNIQAKRETTLSEQLEDDTSPRQPTITDTVTFSTRSAEPEVEDELFYDDLRDFEQADTGYQSVYEDDGSGIVQEYIPAASKSANAESKPSGEDRYRQKRKARRGLLERRISLVLLVVLALCFFGTAALMVVLPRPTQSKLEKRELATVPEFSAESYFSGDFTAGVAYAYDDTVPNRDALKNVGNNFKGLFGLPASENTVEIVGSVTKVNKPANAAPENEPSAVPVQGQDGTVSQIGDGLSSTDMQALLEGAAGRHMDTAPAADPNVPVNNPFNQAEEVDNSGAIMVVKQEGHYRGMELFGGVRGEEYADGLNSLRSQIGGDVKLWSMPAPLACEFYIPDSHREYVTSQSDCFDNTAALLDAGITSINICPALLRHVEEPIYCRTDHHWQPLGAYYAAQTFAQAAGLSFDDISQYEAVTIGDFVGSLYAFSESASLLNDPEDFVYYKPKRQYDVTYYDTDFSFSWGDDDFFQEGKSGSDAYLVYLGGDQLIVKANTDVQNGRKLLLIKDSYGNAMAPFLTGSFQQIYIADIRYMERNLVSFIRDMGITDVLFTVSAFSLVGDNAENIPNLISQNAGETVTDEHP